MNAIAEQFADRRVGSIFLYTHEAHPGENYPHHTNMAQKFEHARALRDLYGVSRPILVDGLEGACHRRYGSMPNMTWIFSRTGIPVYKSDWSDANSVHNALDYLMAMIDRRRNGERMAPFHVERIDYRVQDNVRFTAGLERSGPKAIKEFKAVYPK